MSRILRLALAPALLLGLVACDTKPPYSYVGERGPNAPRISVSEFRDLTPSVQNAAIAAAREASGAASVTHFGTMKVVETWRFGMAVPLQGAPSGAHYPVSTTAMEPWAGAGLHGESFGQVLARNELVLSQTAAQFRRAQAGDFLDIRRFSGPAGIVRVRIGAVVPDNLAPSEMTMSILTAGSLGFSRPSSVQIWGWRSVADIESALARHGLNRAGVRIGRSWDPPNPDSTLGLGRTKSALGEFWYRNLVGGAIQIDPSWFQANVGRVTFAGVPIRASCHVKVNPYIQGALNEIAAAGLAPLINVSNTNSVGGCFAPREIRPSGGTTGGSLSRHTWAMALDMNVSTNQMGAVPQMDCRIVRIFRKWGFAWGGNFTTPDGMHFEWVGQARHNIWFPSRYCPNNVPQPAAATTAATATTTPATTVAPTTTLPLATTLPPDSSVPTESTAPPDEATTVPGDTAAPESTAVAEVAEPATDPSAADPPGSGP
jgi:hypothetical protein